MGVLSHVEEQSGEPARAKPVVRALAEHRFRRSRSHFPPPRGSTDPTGILFGIIGLGIATFSLINAVSQRESGNLTWSRNITKSLHTYPQGTTANPWYDHYSRLFSFDAISGLSSVWAAFVLQYRFNGNDIDQCRVEKSGSSDYTISRLTVSFEGNDATSYEKDSTGCIMMYIGGTADPTGSGDVDFSGSVLVKADGSCVNQDFRITRGDESDLTITSLDSWGYSLIKT